MQGDPRNYTPRSLRGRRTQPALPGVTLPTAPIVVQSQRDAALPQPPVKKRPRYAQRAALKLLGLGALLAVVYLAMYPLLAGAVVDNGAVEQALYGVFPWLPRLFWTAWASFLVKGLNHISVFSLGTGKGASGYANLLLVLLVLAFVLVLIAARIGGRVARERLSANGRRLLLWTIFALTGMMGIIFVFAPAVMSRDLFLYAAYGRMVTVYHVNPYVVSLATYPTQLLSAFVPKGTGVAPYGPLWIDLTLPVVVIARESVANIMIGFRLVGLVAHLANAALIWVILAKLKPEIRISGTLVYAWNPLVLLVGVSEMHYEIVVVFFVLLAVLFCQRNSLLPGWICLLLAALINILAVLLLPLFFRLIWKEARVMRRWRRVLWWLALIVLSGAVVVLAYAPYWRGWSLAGIASGMRQVFLQDSAVNSLDAAIIHLPMGFPPFLSSIVLPHHWVILVAVIAGCLLLLGTWLTDTLEFVLLFSSWIFLALVVLLPVNWPWYILLPLALAISSGNFRTTLLALLLTMGAALEYYFGLLHPVWPGQGLMTIGLPLLIWGWMLFFTSTWHMTRSDDTAQSPAEPVKGPSFSRPSRPSWADRRKPL